VVLKEDGLTERETTRLCPDCEEEYLIEVREPGVRVPVEVYCPACGYTEDVDPEEEFGEEEEAAKEEGDVEELQDIDELSRGDDEAY
jgi:hypothetical protein